MSFDDTSPADEAGTVSFSLLASDKENFRWVGRSLKAFGGLCWIGVVLSVLGGFAIAEQIRNAPAPEDGFDPRTMAANLIVAYIIFISLLSGLLGYWLWQSGSGFAMFAEDNFEEAADFHKGLVNFRRLLTTSVVIAIVPILTAVVAILAAFGIAVVRP